MERQRSASWYHLLRPKSVLLLFFASFSLLFSFLFALFALRHGRPLHLPSGNSAVAEDRRVVAGYLPDRGVGLAMETKEAVTGGGYGDGAQMSGEGLERQDVVNAGNYPLGGLDSAVEVNQEVVPGDGTGEMLQKDSRLEKVNLSEGKNPSKGYVGSITATLSNITNVPTSQDASAKSGPVSSREARGEFLRSVRLRGCGSASVQEVYASEQEEQLETSNRSTVKNSSGETPDNPDKQDQNLIKNTVANKVDKPRNSSAHCDVYDGSWVFDESYPFYTSDSCPFIDEGFNCEVNGRADRNYMKWRWQPKHCNIQRFDARKMLEMLQGKRLVFVGDSLNRNQWESMMCLLRTAISDPARIGETHARRITKEKGFKFLDYNCSVEYHVTHFLVHESKARIGQKRTKTLRIDTIDRGSSRWRGADVLVFNTAHWWSHHKTEAGVNYYQEGDHVLQYLHASTAFQRALTTWASWVDRYINPQQTRVFFRSSSPSHFRGGEWNSGGHCRESTHPLNDTHVRPMPERNVIVEQVIKQMKTPVTVLNITNLSGLRIDGHPSVYGRNVVDLTTSSIQDCSHWCLPGVPDTWNELLFYHLVSSQEKDSALCRPITPPSFSVGI